ncbi:MAG: class I SAM-dependent methyltransferase [Chloroflexi bacterium]|nr:class I SAM-dependent methyltransferase [Chloroflexota bacterium]
MTHASVLLKPGREKSVRQHHPWIFSGAIGDVRGDPSAGETVEVLAFDGTWLARGAYSPASQIRVRLWTWSHEEEIDSGFFEQRLARAVGARSGLAAATDAMRLVHAENDGLPGLILDRYGAWLVVQSLSAGAERWLEVIVPEATRLPGVRGVYERSDAKVREKEGLPLRVGLRAGEEPPQELIVREGEWRFAVDVRGGHKTGFYLDQRDNRRAVHDLAGRLARGGRVLNAFAYSGSFGVAALAGGAGEVVNVDSSGEALRLARRNYALNALATPDASFVEEDVFRFLRQMRDDGQMFDMVILDPPKFAQSAADVMRATRAYKDINWLAFRLVRPGGCVVSFSCSGLVSADLFQKVLFGAAEDAGRQAMIIERLAQPEDHPVRLSFPEGAYLKGLVCRVE